MKPDFSKISTNNTSLLLAYDQGIEHGPQDFNSINIKPDFIFNLAINAKFDGIIVQKGIAEKYYPKYKNKIPLIVKLNGKTKLKKGEPVSTQVCSVNEAADLGAVAVGYTIYLGSQFEEVMLEQFGQIEQQAEEKGLIVIAWMYPRGKSIKKPNSAKNIAYAARVGLELGADMVKINYPGSIKDLSWAVESAGKTKVLVAGGEKLTKQKFFNQVKNIKSAGAYGLAVGRNIWQAKNPQKIAQTIAEIMRTN